MSDPRAFQFAIQGVDESDDAWAAVERRANKTTERLGAGARKLQSRFDRITGPARMLSPELDQAYARMAKMGKLAGSMREAFVSTRVHRNDGMARAERDALVAAQKAADRIAGRLAQGRSAVPAAVALEASAPPANDNRRVQTASEEQGHNAASSPREAQLASSAFEATFAKQMLAAEKRLGVRGGAGMRLAMARIEKDARAGADRAAAQAAGRHKLGRFTGSTAEAAGAQHRDERLAAGGRAKWAEELERGAYDRAYRTHQERGLKRFGLNAADAARRFAGGVGGAGEAGEVASLGRAAGGAAEKLGGAATAAEGVATGFAGLLIAIPAALVGASVAAAKFVSPYARAGQEISRTADLIGVEADKLQRWRGAAELQGLNPHAADSALQNIGQALHNARFGIGDPNQMRLLQLAGVDARKDDEETALGKIASKLTKSGYDAYSQKKYADILGIGDLLPVLKKGPEEIKADLALVNKTGSVQNKDELDKGVRAGRSFTLFDMAKRGVGKRAAMGVMADRAIDESDAARASLQEINGADPVIIAKQLATVTANYVGGGKAVKDMAGAARGAADALGGVAQAAIAPKAHAESPTEVYRVYRQQQDRRFAQPPASRPVDGRVVAGNRALHISDEAEMVRLLRKHGATQAEALVITANAAHESGLNPHAEGDKRLGPGRSAYGLLQWREGRREDFKRMFGKDIRSSSAEEQVRFALAELRGQTGDRGAIRAGRDINANPGDLHAGNASFVRNFERSGNQPRDISERGAILEQIRRDLPHLFAGLPGGGRVAPPPPGEVHIYLHGGSKDTRTVVKRAPGGAGLRVQRAMSPH